MLEDNSEAWFLVCSALHMRHDKLPEMWELGQLLEDGKLCDKCALADAVRPYAYKWLNGCYARNVDQHSRAGLAAAAAMLGMNEEVAQIGVDLIKMSKGVIDGPAEFVAHLPEGLFGKFVRILARPKVTCR